MDIWMLAVLVVWLPVAALLTLLIGCSVRNAERCEQQLRVQYQTRAADPAPAVSVVQGR